MTVIPLQALLVGDVRPLGPRGIPSGIAKLPVDRPLMLGALGLAGDSQGDTRHHGGAEKALHHYALDHYPAWVAEIGQRDVLATAGAFGENLATSGLVESDVAVGDVFAIGSAVIEVSQGRQPCWKLNERFAQPDMARRVQASGRTGWYYRVLEPGEIALALQRRVCDMADRARPRGEHDGAIGEGDSFVEVMGDEQDGLVERAADAQKLHLHVEP